MQSNNSNNVLADYSIQVSEINDSNVISDGRRESGILYDWGPQPVRNRAAQHEVSGRQVSKASSVLIATPHCSCYHLSSSSYEHYGELYNYFIIYYNVIIKEIKCTIVNVMRLNHPKTIPHSPTPVCGKIVFHETGPWCQKVRGQLFYTELPTLSMNLYSII